MNELKNILMPAHQQQPDLLSQISALTGRPVQTGAQNLAQSQAAIQTLLRILGGVGEQAAYVAPGSGEYLSAQDALAKGRQAEQSLMSGDIAGALKQYVDAVPDTLGVIPGIGLGVAAGKRVLKGSNQVVDALSNMPRWQILGLDGPKTARDKMTALEELAELGGAKTPVGPKGGIGDLDTPPWIIPGNFNKKGEMITPNGWFKAQLGKEGRYFMNRIENNRGNSAIHPNSKTGLSLDFSTDCPERLAPCPYCYVEHGRNAKKLFNMHGNDKVITETPYRREILAMPQDAVDLANSQGGLRAHSFSDYRPVQDYNQWKLALADAEAKGLYIKAITKQPEFVEAFGDHPNLRLNISVDDLPREMSNSPTMEEAIRLKADRPNIKIRTVALNEEQAWKQAADPRVDVVTLYHGMTGDNLLKIIKAQNKGLIDKVGLKNIKKEIATWQNMPRSSNAFKRLAEKYPNKVCCQSGKCGGDPTKCGFGNAAAGGLLIGVMLPDFDEWSDEAGSDSSGGVAGRGL